MTSPRSLSRRQTLAAIVLILLAAAALRLVALPDAPPGMTHDEADHGLTAWSIVNGARGLYFAVGYGREPLYDYATALVMRGTGPAILAARLTSVYFSLLLIAATYAWARSAFGAPVALLTAAGLAAGFWPLMTARQALRSIALPAMFALAVGVFWRGLLVERAGGSVSSPFRRGSGRGMLKRYVPSPLLLFAVSGLLLGLTFYTYLPARVMWLALPALMVYIRLQRDSENRLTWLVTLSVAAIVAAPLAVYLAGRPALEVRVGELSAPLRAAVGGDFAPLWANATAALRLFTIEGDQTWRYNLPGRPLLPGPPGWLFYPGLLVAGWLAISRNRVSSEKLGFYPASRPGAFLALAWLALGFAPVVVTGPGLSVTQAIGAQPVLFLFPALALVAAYRVVTGAVSIDDGRQTTDHRRPPTARRKQYTTLAAVCGLSSVVFLILAASTARDYFGRWANSPEVRVQYETTMVTALRWLDEHSTGAAVVSTITPGPLHTPAVALLTLHNPAVQPRWFDGRRSLLLPDAPATLVLPGFTPVPAALQPYWAGAALIDELPLRPDDLDRPVRLYSVDGRVAAEAALARMATTTGGRPLTLLFGENIELLGYEVSAATAQPGETVTLVTAWRLLRPLPGAMLFAHLPGPDRAAGPLAQTDDLGAPGESWTSGDVLLQLHEITLPAGTPPGDYPLVVGVYTLPDGARLPTGAGDSVTLTTLEITD